MTLDEFEQLKLALIDTVKVTVNGKIDKLTLENRETSAKLDAYIISDDLWKERAEPVIDMGINAKGASVVALWIAGAVIALGGAYQIISNLFKK